MSKRKIPYKSSVRGDSPSGTGTGSVYNRDGSSRPSVSSGSPLPYQGKGFEGRWDYLNDLYHQWSHQGSGTGALGANAGNLSNALLEFLGNLKYNNYFTGTEELKAQYIKFLYQLGLINDQRTFDEYLKNDQREYDWSMKQEQRLYDNPQNELARLMGSGISRDAALQLMSGSAGGSGLGTGSSVPYGSGTGISAPDPTGTPGTQNLAIAQTAINGVQAFMQLVQSGVGVAEGIEQVKAMQAQNYWNSEQMQSYDAVKQVGTQIEQLKASGVLDDDTISSWKNLEDMQVWLDDHADTNGVAPLVQSGALNRAFGTPFGRNRMTNFFSDVIKGRSEGEQVDAFIQQQHLNNELSSINNAEARRTYYSNLATTLNDILSSDAELQLLWQQYATGEKELEILGERVKQEKYQTAMARRANERDRIDFNSFKSALDDKYVVNKDGYQRTLNGYDILNYNQYSRLVRMWYTNSTLTGLQAGHYRDRSGVEIVDSARGRYAKFLDQNLQAAITGAFINDVINSNHLQGYSGDLSPLYKFADMWNFSGMGDIVKSVDGVTPTFNVNTGDRFFIK